MFKFFVLLIAIGYSLCSFAQRENDTWYFGNKAGIKFNNGNAIVTNSNIIGGVRASISDRNTGNLRLYTDGITIRDKNNNIIPGGILQPLRNPQALFVPFPGSATKYYLFHSTNYSLSRGAYYIIDMSLNGGLGQVILSKDMYIGVYLAAVKHAYNNSYWLISHAGWRTNEFRAYNISENGIDTIAKISKAGPQVSLSWSEPFRISSSTDGKKLIAVHNNYASTADIYVYDFDKTCGIILSEVKLPKDDYIRTWSACFSPDNSKIYVTGNIPRTSHYLYANFIFQYSGANYNKVDTVVQTDHSAFGDIRLGPDNRVYIIALDSVEISSYPRYTYTDLGSVNVIQYPNNPVTTCGYKVNGLDLGTAGGGFPNFINDRTQPGPNADNPGVDIKIKGICPGDSTHFSTLPPLMPDSIHWDFGDTGSLQNTSKLLNPSHLYSDTGIFGVGIKWYKCGYEIKQSLKVAIQDFKNISLGLDTAFCYKDSITLSTGITGATHLWNTGEKTETITVNKPRKYWVNAESGACKGGDTITIKEIPPILIEIGNEYKICDDDNELVKLDAGKGYTYYMWTPTGDNTQWIIVKKAGDYYVVVEDYHGCKGDDDAKVLRQCSFTFFIPNSFTPNGDGLNDVFGPTTTDITEYSIEIYNTWGEKIFESIDPTIGWDGTYKNQTAPIGAYIWQLKFKGFHNKLLRNYNHRGVVNLVR